MQGLPSWYIAKQEKAERQEARTREECSRRVDECQHELRTASPTLKPGVVGRWSRYADELEKTAMGGMFSNSQKAEMRGAVAAIRRTLKPA